MVQTVQTEPLKEILNELFSLLETLETNNAALLQFLRDQGIATDEKLSAYLEQAGRASNVKWLAARKRMEYLLNPIQKEERDGEKAKGQTQKERAEDVAGTGDRQNEKNSQEKRVEAAAQALAGKPVQSSRESEEKKENRQHEDATDSNEKGGTAKAAKASERKSSDEQNKPAKIRI